MIPMSFGDTLTLALATATLAGNLGFLGLLIFFVVRRSIFGAAMGFIGKRAICLMLLVSALAVAGSLLYSEVMGFAACILCWIQRFLMYPIPFLGAAGIFRRSLPVLEASFTLSLLGAGVGAYQWTKDMLLLYGNNIASLGCPEVAGLPSCDKIYINEFGYITIPMLSLNAFLWLLLISYAGLRARK